MHVVARVVVCVVEGGGGLVGGSEWVGGCACGFVGRCVHKCGCVCVCVRTCVGTCVRACVCVCEREREADTETERDSDRDRVLINLVSFCSLHDRQIIITLSAYNEMKQ